MPPYVVFTLITCAIVGWLIARREGHPVWGLLVGLIFGPLGLLVIAIFAARHDVKARRQV